MTDGEMSKLAGSAKETELCKKALLKKAAGYKYCETVDEYNVDNDGSLVHSKRKISSKHMPPDLAALKLLLCEQKEEQGFDGMSDEELELEKKKLLLLLAKNEQNSKDDKNPNKGTNNEK